MPNIRYPLVIPAQGGMTRKMETICEERNSSAGRSKKQIVVDARQGASAMGLKRRTLASPALYWPKALGLCRQCANLVKMSA